MRKHECLVILVLYWLFFWWFNDSWNGDAQRPKDQVLHWLTTMIASENPSSRVLGQKNDGTTLQHQPQFKYGPTVAMQEIKDMTPESLQEAKSKMQKERSDSDAGCYPLVMTNIAIENGHRNSGFSHYIKMVIFHSYVSLPEGTGSAFVAHGIIPWSTALFCRCKWVNISQHWFPMATPVRPSVVPMLSPWVSACP